jgi:hypothetical protein
MNRGRSWLDLANRGERLRTDPVTGGRHCDWPDSSRLTVARVFPKVGLRLAERVLQEWPVQLRAADEPLSRAQAPQVSLLVAIGGQGRVPQFNLCLASARAQVGASVEIVVVEQSSEPSLAACLPADVVYLHQSAGEEGSGFNKSRALNAGARIARGRNLVVLDADMLLPTAFCREVTRVLEQVEGTRPARLLFNLDRQATAALVPGSSVRSVAGLEDIVANAPNPIALRASTYREIGGHDEDYAGWGGEDTEFLDRLRTRPVAEGGWLPVLHAWHEPAPAKAPGLKNAALHRKKMCISPHERIRRLLSAGEQARLHDPDA